MELEAYRILDTAPEKELEDIVNIACAVCDAPTSMITLIASERAWFKAKKGILLKEATREHAFCTLALTTQRDIVVIPDSTQDPRFQKNPLVLEYPYIRFYAGVPLTTPAGHVLGCLCVTHTQPRTISDHQAKALKLLAKKAMNYLVARKLLLEQNTVMENCMTQAERLARRVLGVTFQLEMDSRGQISFSFVDEKIKSFYPRLSPNGGGLPSPSFFDLIHPDDQPSVRDALQISAQQLSTWSQEYRIMLNDRTVWCCSEAKPEKRANGTVVWYGSIVDATERRECTGMVERILFDISHTIRRPLATLMGLTNIIQTQSLDDESFQQLLNHLETVSQEMDARIRGLNETYLDIKSSISDRQKQVS